MKILVATYTNLYGYPYKLPAFYEGFVKSLLNLGHDVYLMLSNSIIAEYHNDNQLSPIYANQSVNSAIKAIDLDLVISFNHSLYHDLVDIVDCPILIWVVDSINCLTRKDIVKQRKDRYHIVVPAEYMVQDAVDLGYNRKRVIYLPPATELGALDIKQDKNIAFIGSYFETSIFTELLHYLDSSSSELRVELLRVIKSYEDNITIPFKERASKELLQALVGYREVDKLFDRYYDFLDILCMNYISLNYRVDVLSRVSGLGLSLYGNSEWKSKVPHNIDLTLSYNDKFVYSIADQEQVYNSHKLNINISHYQANGGMPWRICDIMASNGLLVADKISFPEINRFFGKEVDIPYFSTADQAYDICKYFLNNEAERCEIVSKAQKLIRQRHRFKHRFQVLDDYLGTNIAKERLENKGRLCYVPQYEVGNFAERDIQHIEIKKKIWVRIIHYLIKKTLFILPKKLERISKKIGKRFFNKLLSDQEKVAIIEYYKQ